MTGTVRDWTWQATAESRAQEQVSVRAGAEVLALGSLMWWVAAHHHISWHLLLAVALSPLLLLMVRRAHCAGLPLLWQEYGLCVDTGTPADASRDTAPRPVVQAVALVVKCGFWFWWPVLWMLKPLPPGEQEAGFEEDAGSVPGPAARRAGGGDAELAEYLNEYAAYPPQDEPASPARTASLQRRLCWQAWSQWQLVVAGSVMLAGSVSALVLRVHPASAESPVVVLKHALGLQWYEVSFFWKETLLLALICSGLMLWISARANAERIAGRWAAYAQSRMPVHLRRMRRLSRARRVLAGVLLVLSTAHCLISLPELRRHLPAPLLQRMELVLLGPKKKQRSR